jgi:hypothetical protein
VLIAILRASLRYTFDGLTPTNARNTNADPIGLTRGNSAVKRERYKFQDQQYRQPVTNNRRERQVRGNWGRSILHSARRAPNRLWVRLIHAVRSSTAYPSITKGFDSALGMKFIAYAAV